MGICTNLAFFRQASTSEGKDEETCGCVAVAEASQFSWGCCMAAMMICQPRARILRSLASISVQQAKGGFMTFTFVEAGTLGQCLL